MEHVLGVSLRNLLRAAIRQDLAFPVGVVVGLMAQASAGAHAAHELTDPEGTPLGLVQLIYPSSNDDLAAQLLDGGLQFASLSPT